MKNIHRILVSRLRFMGDIILTTPLIQALSEAFPQAKITYLAETPFISLLENHPQIHDLIPFEFNRIRNLRGWELLKEQYYFFRNLRKQRFDLAIDLFGNPRSAFQTWLSGARYRVGGDYKGRGRLYNRRINYRGLRLNAIQYHLKTLEALEIPLPENPKTHIFTTPAEDKWATDFLKSLDIDPTLPIVGLHPGATWPAKMWHWNRFADLIRQIKTQLKLPVLLTQGPEDEVRIQQIQKYLDFKVKTTGLLSLRQLAALQKQFAIYVSNDCGPLHLAIAVGTKTLGIFGPGEPDIWFPYSFSEGHRFIHHPPACWPCHRDFCDSLVCMDAIETKEVLTTIQEMLEIKS